MCLSLVATLAAKWTSAAQLEFERTLAFTAQLIWLDFAIFVGLASLLSLLECIGRYARLVTWPLSLGTALLALANALYLMIAGQQGSWRLALELWERREDARLIIEEVASPQLVAAVALVFGVSLAIPLLARFWLDRSGYLRQPHKRRAADRVRFAGVAALIALLLGLALPSTPSLEVRHLAENGIFNFIKTAVASRADNRKAEFAGWFPANVVSEDEIRRMAARADRPNVVIVILESTRYDHTAMSGYHGKARTPNMRELVLEGFVAARMRAVVPHTTKSLFTILCGRYPIALTETLELNENTDTQCLANILGSAGYRTAFYQSASGIFEFRPRLVDRFGFEEFKAWEDIGGERLGYLASPDMSLAEPALEFFEEQASRPDQPFLLTILTSASHDPYRLPESVKRQAEEENLPHESRSERYTRLVEESDSLLGRLMRGLETNGQRENTLILVTGDHGEGLGDHGLNQHDDNFWESGLRVPFVIAGPGVSHERVKQNANLLDVLPTLLGILGIESTGKGLKGYDLLDGTVRSDREPRYFICYRGWKCHGFVYGDHKVVMDGYKNSGVYFDLIKDPKERSAMPLLPSHGELVRELGFIVRSHMVAKWKAKYSRVNRYHPWKCPADFPRCKHPEALEEKHRTPPLIP